MSPSCQTKEVSLPASLSARERLRRVADSTRFQMFIAVVILINAASLGLETSATMTRLIGPALESVGHVSLLIFVVELFLRITAHGVSFFRHGWNLFDFGIVLVTGVPAWPNLSVLRALRIVRTLRFFSIVPQLRTVVQAMVTAIPSMASILIMLLLWFYIAGVLATQFFGDVFKEWFGHVGRSMYSLFQIMTLESWSMGIVRPVMKVYPAAWAFFVPFIVVTTFTMLNLFIAFLVSATQTQADTERKEAEEAAPKPPSEKDELASQIALLRQELAQVRSSLEPDLQRLRSNQGPIVPEDK